MAICDSNVEIAAATVLTIAIIGAFLLAVITALFDRHTSPFKRWRR